VGGSQKSCGVVLWVCVCLKERGDAVWRFLFLYLSKRIAISFVADFPIIIYSLRLLASWSQDFYAGQDRRLFTENGTGSKEFSVTDEFAKCYNTKEKV
jgi:hypothetical protein